MTKFKIQKENCSVNWTGKKVLGLHTGTINVLEGYFDFYNNEVRNSEVVIDMTSLIITDIKDEKTHKEFKDHLWNDDFFAIDKFKTSKLVISEGKLIGENEYRINGILTIKDIAHPISFNTKIEILTDYFYSRGEIIIDRTLYNIRYGSGKFIKNLGNKLIYDDFVLQFKIVGQQTN